MQLWNLPIKGISQVFSVDKESVLTSGHINNMRPQGLEKRIILWQRPGLDKWSTDQVGGSEQPVVCMAVVYSIA